MHNFDFIDFNIKDAPGSGKPIVENADRIMKIVEYEHYNNCPKGRHIPKNVWIDFKKGSGVITNYLRITIMLTVFEADGNR